MAPRDLITPAELSALLRVHVKTLASWRRRGEGPPWIQVGRQVRYARADVDRWLAGRHFT